MRKTLLQLLTFVVCITSMQNPLLAQEQTPLNQVVNTLKERISLAGYASWDIRTMMHQTGQYIRYQTNYFHGTRKNHQTLDL